MPFQWKLTVPVPPAASFFMSTVVVGIGGIVCSSVTPRATGHPKHLVAAERPHEALVRNRLATRLRRVEPHDPDRLRAQLVDRPRAVVALEEADRDERRDESGEEDAEQEERRKPEAERPEHGPSS